MDIECTYNRFDLWVVLMDSRRMNYAKQMQFF